MKKALQSHLRSQPTPIEQTAPQPSSMDPIQNFMNSKQLPEPVQTSDANFGQPLNSNGFQFPNGPYAIVPINNTMSLLTDRQNEQTNNSMFVPIGYTLCYKEDFANNSIQSKKHSRIRHQCNKNSEEVSKLESIKNNDRDHQDSHIDDQWNTKEMSLMGKRGSMVKRTLEQHDRKIIESGVVKARKRSTTEQTHKQLVQKDEQMHSPKNTLKGDSNQHRGKGHVETRQVYPRVPVELSKNNSSQQLASFQDPNAPLFPIKPKENETSIRKESNEPEDASVALHAVPPSQQTNLGHFIKANDSLIHKPLNQISNETNQFSKQLLIFENSKHKTEKSDDLKVEGLKGPQNVQLKGLNDRNQQVKTQGSDDLPDLIPQKSIEKNLFEGFDKLSKRKDDSDQTSNNRIMSTFIDNSLKTTHLGDTQPKQTLFPNIFTQSDKTTPHEQTQSPIKEKKEFASLDDKKHENPPKQTADSKTHNPLFSFATKSDTLDSNSIIPTPSNNNPKPLFANNFSIEKEPVILSKVDPQSTKEIPPEGEYKQQVIDTQSSKSRDNNPVFQSQTPSISPPPPSISNNPFLTHTKPQGLQEVISANKDFNYFNTNNNPSTAPTGTFLSSFHPTQSFSTHVSSELSMIPNMFNQNASFADSKTSQSHSPNLFPQNQQSNQPFSLLSSANRSLYSGFPSTGLFSINTEKDIKGENAENNSLFPKNQNPLDTTNAKLGLFGNSIGVSGNSLLFPPPQNNQEFPQPQTNQLFSKNQVIETPNSGDTQQGMFKFGLSDSNQNGQNFFFNTPNQNNQQNNPFQHSLFDKK